MEESMEQPPIYFRYWGKAEKGEGNLVALYHLLPYHCLDVAAVGQQLLERLPHLRSQLARRLGMDEVLFSRWVLFLLALHDLGKFTDSFQRVRADILKILQGRESSAFWGVRHDTLGYRLWAEHIVDHLTELGMLSERMPRSRCKPKDHTILNSWISAVAGHHGEPPKMEDFILSNYMSGTDVEAAKEFVAAVSQLFLVDECAFPDLDEDRAVTGSWWLAGFIVLCDWLGSSREPSDFKTEPESLTSYWADALCWADEVVEKSGLTSPQANQHFALNDFFDGKDDVTPTPLQVQVQEQTLDNGPQLFILEDVTGAGKTEAAILLLNRFMVAGLADGLYFALPTMATSNGMYRRMGPVYQKLYVETSTPSCVLAHSAREMSDAFRQSISIVGDEAQNDNGDGTMSAAAHCSAWLADNRKKALLANVGVGTVDQAVLAVLPSRHQSLRLLGMLGKCLIFDEIHNVDARQNVLICHLLQAHASTGGSAILLSATLSKKQRSEFVKAFSAGLGRARPVLERFSEADYPLLTQLGPTRFDEVVLPTRNSVKRRVKIVFIHDEQEIYQLINEASQQGKCLCWIRNTIKEARKSYQTLQSGIPAEKLKLFHARYAMHDRLEIENSVLGQFGPESKEKDRVGQVLIASQVVQESLDLDFDLLISDLSPSDLVIQRAGRFRRHIRDAQGNRLKEGVDQRGEPILYIHAPEWSDEPVADWAKSWSSGSNAIYEASQLWLTQKWLKAKGEFRMPEDARAMVEAVYGDETAAVPDGLLRSANEAEGKSAAVRSIGKSDALKWEQGYQRDGNWWDEASTPTRDIEENSHSIYLACWQDGKFTPWVNEGDFCWARSAVSMIEKKINAEADYADIPKEQISKIKEAMPAKGKWGVLMPLLPIGDERWRGLALDGKGEQVVFYYDKELGLMEAEEVQLLSANEVIK